MDLKEVLLNFQENEATEHIVYSKLSELNNKNKKVLKKISDDELRHYNICKKYTKIEAYPKKFKVWYYTLLARVFGLTFAIKLMEQGEKNVQEGYSRLKGSVIEIKKIIKDEEKHERALIGIIEEDRLEYLSSMALGINDALVEITGVLSGLSLAFQNTKLIGAAGLITGISASMSMASSEYLSQRTEVGNKVPTKAAFYTGLVYLITVLFLVFPYFIFNKFYYALLTTLIIAFIIIFFFSFFISITKEFSLKRRFLEMLAVSLGVATISFLIGYLTKIILGVGV